MIGSSLVDRIQRRINSILFRVLLCGYAVFLVLIQENCFDDWVYTVAIVVYFVIYLNLMKFDRIRLLWDYIFIQFILLGKNPNEVINFAILLFPIVNSINFSGKSKSVLLYVFTLAVYLNTLCWYAHQINVNFLCSNLAPTMAFVFLWLINWYTSLRTKVRSFRDELNEAVDNYYVKDGEIRRPHKVYEIKRDIINKNIKDQLVDNIVCFTVVKRKKEDKLAFLNGSEFYWYVRFRGKDVVERLRKSGAIQDEPIQTEKGLFRYNIIVFIRVEGIEYAFAIITKTSIPFYYLLIGIFRTVDPVFYKIAKILLSERKLREMRNEEIKKLSERSQYVNRANKTMHFMRNRMGPFSNMLKMLDNFDVIPSDKLASFKSLLFSERDRAKIELHNITERANDMLEKSNNPFVYQSVAKVSIEKVFTILKRNFYAFFPDEQIAIAAPRDIGHFNIALNEEGFEVFLSDWLNNMLKYKKRTATCKFEISGDNLVITFANDHNNSPEMMRAIVSDLTSNDRYEIMKRTTHGLPIIRGILEDMNIGYQVSNNDEKNILTFTIILKLHSK